MIKKIKNIIKIVFLIAPFLFLTTPLVSEATLVGTTNNAALGLSNGIISPLETGVYKVGPTFPIDIYVNTHGQAVNAVAVYINYNPALFTVDAIDYSGSVFTIQWESSTNSPVGMIKIGRSIAGSTINSTNAKIATLMLRGLTDATPSSDNFTFDFVAGDASRSAVFLADAQGGNNILSGVYNARYSLDGTPPANVSSFTATSGGGQISLNWANPTSDFAGVKILRKTGSYPTSPTDGTQVYDSTGTSYVDTGLTNGTTYYYTAFSRDIVVNYSSGAQASAIAKDSVAPASISTSAATALTARTVKFDWTAVGDDGTTGTATSYDIRYSTTAITAANFSSATPVSGAPTPRVSGTAETMAVAGLNGDTTYYFAIKAIDGSSNASTISNVLSAKTYRTADINNNSYVNMQDVSIMMAYWGNAARPPADINQDGYVNMQDVSIMMSQWD